MREAPKFVQYFMKKLGKKKPWREKKLWSGFTLCVSFFIFFLHFIKKSNTPRGGGGYTAKYAPLNRWLPWGGTLQNYDPNQIFSDLQHETIYNLVKTCVLSKKKNPFVLNSSLDPIIRSQRSKFKCHKRYLVILPFYFDMTCV